MSPSPPRRGFTLIEALVSLAVLSLLMVVAAPQLSTWLQNSRIRVNAESVLTGLQQARSEAVSRNARVRFQLTTSADNSCQPSVTGTSWAVNLDVGNATGHCGDTPDADNPSPSSVGRLIVVHSGAEGGGNATVSANASSLAFNSIGRPVAGTPAAPTPLTTNFTVDVTYQNVPCPPSTLTCLRVVVTPQGQVRMCNPKLVAANDPRGC